MRAIIHSRKHYVQVSLATVLSGAVLDTIIAFPKEVADDANEVEVGATIKAVYVEMWVRAGDTAPGSVTLDLYKTSSGAVGMSAVEAAALHDYANKKNILYHTQGLSNDQDADAIPFIRQWFKIPKGKQRMGLGDTLRLNIFAQAIDAIVCGFITYKEYS